MRQTVYLPSESIKKKKMEWDLGLNRHMVAAIGQTKFCPPYSPPKAVPRYRGAGG